MINSRYTIKLFCRLSALLDASFPHIHVTSLGRLIEIRLEGSDVSALMPDMKLVDSAKPGRLKSAAD